MSRILLLPGDGVGPEVVAEARACLEMVAAASGFELDFDSQPFGGAAIDAVGDPLPPATLAAARAADAILLGAVGGPQYVAANRTPEMGLLALRSELGLFANLRPARVIDGLEHLSPLKDERVRGSDILVIRELTGGLYFGEKQRRGDMASDLCVYTRPEVERIARIGFEAARGRRGRLTSVDKANVLETSRLWREVVSGMAADYPDVTLDHLYVDAAAMHLAMRPASFDVIVTENLFGDILSDQLSVIGGSIGLLPSASRGNDGPMLFEPIHGSAPDIAGTGKVNPAGAIASAAMLLDMALGRSEEAAMLVAALENTLRDGVRTADLGGSARSSEFGEAVRQRLAATVKEAA